MIKACKKVCPQKLQLRTSKMEIHATFIIEDKLCLKLRNKVELNRTYHNGVYREPRTPMLLQQ